jgi:hypothetical protein
MSAVAINSFAGEAEEIDFTPVMIYGIVADVLCIVPIILYMVAKESTTTATATTGLTTAQIAAAAATAATAGIKFNQFHQTMINMLVSAWMPFGISWIIALAADGPLARAGLAGAMSMAGLGPFALQWVGLMSFIMTAHTATVLDSW